MSAMKLLLMEDDPAVRRLVTNRLEMEGVTVTLATTVAEAMMAIHHEIFDAAILDLTLPDGSGLEVLRGLRALGSTTHVTILSGAGSEIDRVGALDLGADDYVVKPFFVRELTARILAVQRRQDASNVTALHYGPLRIDLTAREITVDDVLLHLTTKEFDLLACMAAASPAGVQPRRPPARGVALRRRLAAGVHGDGAHPSPAGEDRGRPPQPVHPAHRPRRRLPLRPAGRGRARHDGGRCRGHPRQPVSRSATGRSWRAGDNMKTTSRRSRPEPSKGWSSPKRQMTGCTTGDAREVLRP